MTFILSCVCTCPNLIKSKTGSCGRDSYVPCSMPWKRIIWPIIRKRILSLSGSSKNKHSQSPLTPWHVFFQLSIRTYESLHSLTDSSGARIRNYIMRCQGVHRPAIPGHTRFLPGNDDMPCVFTDEEFAEEVRLSEASGFISQEEAEAIFAKWGFVR